MFLCIFVIVSTQQFSVTARYKISSVPKFVFFLIILLSEVGIYFDSPSTCKKKNTNLLHLFAAK